MFFVGGDPVLWGMFSTVLVEQNLSMCSYGVGGGYWGSGFFIVLL